jgi:hypothetical protein
MKLSALVSDSCHRRGDESSHMTFYNDSLSGIKVPFKIVFNNKHTEAGEDITLCGSFIQTGRK